ncbi:hypothetical protein [Fulvivirga aurantia]|uniref:hypothetical protein n=1 Tax=Fulvivirga aurantia TaxID=2529383 RepID=UPI001CA45B55|nr:hypothetical protein [Fulvivirga aurantia]
MASCSDDDEAPAPEEEEEVISRAELTFTPTGEGDVVTATWFDADGEGTGAPTIDNIELVEGLEYELSIKLTNTLASPAEDITAEVEGEDDEHMFFYEFTNNIFADPTGNGNVDNRGDEVNYNDFDDNGNPLGLSTNWTAGAHTESAGIFRVVLKHQPDIKSATSTINDGGTDLDITFPISIVEDPNAEEEVINEIVLTFSPVGGGDDITATWFDADGDGVGNPTIDDIELAADTEYDLAITLANTLAGEDITAEIEAEDDEHMFFFAFTDGAFSSPTGDGNIDNRSDALNYNDEDMNGEPVGLSTNWTTAGVSTGNTFRVVLKHQPGIKSSTSSAADGGTDVDIEFTLNVN